MIHYTNRDDVVIYKPSIETAFDILPERLHSLVSDIDIVCGTSSWEQKFGVSRFTVDGRELCKTAHTFLPADRSAKPIIFLPRPRSPETVLHEFGHVIHTVLGFPSHVIRPVTQYAKTNSMEAFAEAFIVWLGFTSRAIAELDTDTIDFFNRIAHKVEYQWIAAAAPDGTVR